MRFEFLPAFQGDCFLIHGGSEDEPALILVDGGPGGTYEQHLRPHLMELREQRGLDDLQPLVIDLVIVSHVDDDHINGIISLLREMSDEARAGNSPPFEVRELWHNSFDEIIGNDEVTVEAAQFGAASFAPLLDEAVEQEEHDAALILQSIAQGHQLRDLAEELRLPVNGNFPGLVMTRAGELVTETVGGISFTVIGPRPAELAALQKQHDKWLKQQKKKGKAITPASLLLSLKDRSVANLSSIVLLAERDGRKALLTGDARSDFILKGLEEAELISGSGAFEVDLLKMPHHGSDRNVNKAFLKRVPARQYVFSGNGDHGNPDRDTFDMLAKARPDAEVELYLTYDLATIDNERERLHERDRDRDSRKKRAGKLRGEPRPEWSPSEHSLAALPDRLPGSYQLIEPAGPVIEL